MKIKIPHLKQILDANLILAKKIYQDNEKLYKEKYNLPDGESYDKTYNELDIKTTKNNHILESILSDLIVAKEFDSYFPDKTDEHLYDVCKVWTSQKTRDVMSQFDKDILNLQGIYSTERIEQIVSMRILFSCFSISKDLDKEEDFVFYIEDDVLIDKTK